MKEYKIGYISTVYGKDDMEYYYFFYHIKYLIKDNNIDLKPILVNDYTNEECDLVLYSQSVEYNDVKTYKVFNQAKGNPKFLLIKWHEGHSFPIYDGNELNNSLTRTISYYIGYNKHFYSISSYDDTTYNCYEPLFSTDLDQIFKRKHNIINNRNTEKKYFCNIISSHNTKERINFTDYISNNYKKVDIYGNMYINNFKQQNKITEEELNNIIPHYKFSLVIENTKSDYNEGYITEKINRAFMFGTVPIYWGNNKQIYDAYDECSIINITDCSPEEAVEKIKLVDSNDELYLKMLNHNIFDKSKKYFNNIFKNKDKFILNILLNKI